MPQLQVLATRRSRLCVILIYRFIVCSKCHVYYKPVYDAIVSSMRYCWRSLCNFITWCSSLVVEVCSCCQWIMTIIRMTCDESVCGLYMLLWQRFLREAAVPAGTADSAYISYGNSVRLSVLVSRPGTESSAGQIETPGFHRMIV